MTKIQSWDYFLAISTKKGKENIEEFYRKYREAEPVSVTFAEFAIAIRF